MAPPERGERWGRREILRRTAPVTLVMVLAFVTVPLGENETDEALVLGAAALMVALVALVILVPWGRLPGWLILVPPYAGLLVIAMLRHAEGGAMSGFGVLALIPVLWIALYGNRRELIVMLAAVAAFFVIPILVFGAPDYPDGEWRRAILTTAMAAFAGLVTQDLVGVVRKRAAEAEKRARAEAEREAYLRAVMDSAAEGIIAVDGSGRATFVNPAAARFCGYEIGEMIGERMHALVHHSRPDGTPYPAEECPVSETLRTGNRSVVNDEVYWRKDGTSFPVEYRATAMVVDGEVVGVVNTFIDISERLAVQRTRDEFVSVVSHELRTPLTSIRGSLGLMEGGVMGDLTDEARKMISIAISNADRLVRLINDILDAERMESGEAPMDMRSVEIADLLRQTQELLAPAAEDAGVELVVEPVEARIVADPDRIIQTLVNLVGNAIKFSGEGTTVRVHGSVEQGQVHAGGVQVRITDQGPGIPADQQAAIFDRFVQVDSAATRVKGGSGLGLSIAQRIVEHHGGRIWIDSSGDEGTTFAFELPLPRRSEHGPGAGDGSPAVLVVEDDADLAEVLATALESHGFRAVSVTTLAEADEVLREATPALLVLDVDLPETGSTELIAWLRDTEAAAESEVLVYTALDLGAEQLAMLREFGEVMTKAGADVREFERRALAKLGVRVG